MRKKTHSTVARRQAAVHLALWALAIYSVLFFLLSRYLPSSRSWQGLPQLYFLAASWIVLQRAGWSWRELGWRASQWRQDLLIGCLVALIPLLVIGRYVWFGAESAPPIWHGHGRAWYQLFVLVILAPVAEELFFRGTLTMLLLERLRVWLLLPLVTLLFAAAHFEWHIGPILLGLTTTWLAIWRRSMLPGLVLHCVCNLFGPLLIYGAPEVYRELRIFFL